MVVLVLALLFSAANLTYALPTYTGYSGAPGRGTCAGSCHGSGGGTATITGFPAQYTPGQSYLITIGHSSGDIIANLNGSCRIGTGSDNAGTISAGTNTATYSTTGETNGIHFSSPSHDDGTFNWLAPSAGTGTVSLYVAAHQGTYSGANTVIVLTSDEASSLPDPATNPTPADGATNISPDVVFSWTAGNGATSHDVNFGTSNPPPFIANQTATSYDPPGSLTPGTLYYWRIDERNAGGVTTGVVWQFTVMSLPQTASQPDPANNAVDVLPAVVLSWTAGGGAESHDVYFGTANPPAFIGNQTTTSYDPPGDLQPGSVYYWRIDERNAAGVTTGDIWQFTVLSLPAAATQPSPPDGATDVSDNVVLSWTPGTGSTSHDVNFGTSNPPPFVVNQTATQYDPPESLTPATVYYWRIDERNAAGVTVGTVWQFTTEATAAGEISSGVPAAYALGSAFPNPFNAVVSIPFAIPRASEIRLSIFDLQGREVAVLTRGEIPAGMHTVQWNGADAGTGIYFVRLQTPAGQFTGKIALLK